MRSVAVKCDADSAALLRAIAKLWPRVIAAQQSNLMSEAFDLSDANFRSSLNSGELRINTTPSCRIQFDNDKMAETDAFRFRELCRLWPSLRRSSQEQLLGRVEDVTGAAFATAE